MKWNDAYALKIPKIDNQHKELFSILDTLNKSFDRGTTHKESLQAIKFMAEYIKHHFKSEEELMKLIRYPELHLQKQMHKEFIAYFSKQIKSLKNKHDINLFEIRDFIADWIISHIIQEDTKIKKYLNDKKQDKDFVKSLTKQDSEDIVEDVFAQCKRITSLYEKRILNDEGYTQKVSSIVEEFLTDYGYNTLMELYDKKKMVDTLIEHNYFEEEQEEDFWRTHINPNMLEMMVEASDDINRDLLLLDTLMEEGVLSVKQHEKTVAIAKGFHENHKA